MPATLRLGSRMVGGGLLEDQILFWVRWGRVRILFMSHRGFFRFEDSYRCPRISLSRRMASRSGNIERHSCLST